MQIRSHWKEKLIFTAESDSQKVDMDAPSPLGSNHGFTPKELVVAGLTGCKINGNLDKAKVIEISALAKF
jgi:uncharacterized OsmC-like protein